MKKKLNSLEFFAGLFVPALVETVNRYPNDLGFLNYILVKNVCLMLIALLALSTGLFVSVKEIIHIYV